MRTYQTTHPWITFELELKRVPWDFCLLVGQMISHIEHLSGIPLSPDLANRIAGHYAVKGAHSSAALEGNTLNEAEVVQRLAGELNLPPSKEYLGAEIDNIVAATRWIENQHAAGTLPGFGPELIMQLNRKVLAGLHFEEEVIPGRLRGYSIGVADYRGAPAEDLDELVFQLCTWIGRPWFRSAGSIREHGSNGNGNGTARPAAFASVRDQDMRWLEAILKAVLAHAYLMWIYPFDAGNGPTARLIEFSILVHAGVPYPAAHLLAKHYHETGSEYQRQLTETAQLGGDAIRFCLYAVRGFVDQLRELLETIRSAQGKIFWQTHVEQILGDSDAAARRRHLIEDLATHPRPLEKYDLPEVSARVARAYAALNEKTFLRDLEALADAGLLDRMADGKYRARVEGIAAFGR